MADLLSGGAVDQAREGISLAQLFATKVHQDEVGGLAGFEAAADLVETDRSGPLDGEHAGCLVSTQRPRPGLELGKEGGLAAFGEGVEPVVAGGAVRTEADPDTAFAKAHDGGDA